MSWSYQQDLSPTENYTLLEEFYESSASPNNTCVVCDGKEFTHFQRQLARCKSMHFQFTSTNYQSCDKCGTIMVDKTYPPEFYFQFINNFYDVESFDIIPGSYIKPLVRNAFISTVTSPSNFRPTSILEISSYDGATMDYFKREYDAEVYGVEPTTLTLQAAQRNFPFMADTMYNCLLECSADDLAGKKFDLIISSMAFRQNAHPLESLKIIEEIITDDGYMYIDEGNFLDDCFASFSSYEYGAALNQCKNFYYTLNSIIYLFEKHGFEYIASQRRHESDKRTAESDPLALYQPRYSAVLFKRNKNVVPDEDRLKRSKIISDALVELFHDSYKSEDEILKTLKLHHSPEAH